MEGKKAFPPIQRFEGRQVLGWGDVSSTISKRDSPG